MMNNDEVIMQQDTQRYSDPERFFRPQSPKNTKKLNFIVDGARYKKLSFLALNNDLTMTSLLIEAVDDLLEKYSADLDGIKGMF